MSGTMAISMAISDEICHVFECLFLTKQRIRCPNITLGIAIEIFTLFLRKKIMNIFKYFSRNSSETDIIFHLIDISRAPLKWWACGVTSVKLRRVRESWSSVARPAPSKMSGGGR